MTDTHTPVPTQTGGYPARLVIHGGDDAEDSLDLMRLFGALWSGKYVIVLSVVLFFAAAFCYALFIAQEQYRSAISLVLEPADQQIVDIESVISATPADRVSINTELRIIRSPSVIQGVVEDLNLTEDPEFNIALQEPGTFSRANIRRVVLELLGRDASVGALPADVIMDRTVSRLRSSVSVSAQRETYIMNIAVVTSNGAKSNRIANAIAARYLSNQVETKYAATEYAVSWLTERVGELETDLKRREGAIAGLLSEQLVSDAAQAALQVRASELRQRIALLDAQNMQARADMEQLEAAITSRDFSQMVAVLDDPSLADDLQAALSGNRLLANRLLNEARRVAQNQSNTILRNTGQVTALRASYAELQDRIDSQNTALSEFNKLTREAENTRILYETFLARLKETSLQMSLQQADSRIMSPANRGSLIAPRRARIMMMAIILGAMVGAAVVLFRQFVYSGFRNVDELESFTKQPVLGQVPTFPSRRRGDILEHLIGKPTGAAAESIRDLRTSILMSDLDNAPQVILSTSSVPGEGKTTMAVSLAHNLAGLGKRVLLIECDVRRCTLLEYFEHQGNSTIIEMLADNVPLADAVAHQPTAGIDVLFGKKTKINPADLFASQKFEHLLSEARAAYDYVVIDAPPVLVVPDARVISRHSDALIYSVRWNMTHRGQVREGLRQLAAAGGGGATGLILSQVNARQMKRYGYGGRYGTYGPYSSYSSSYYDT